VDPTATRGHYRARLASCYFSVRFGCFVVSGLPRSPASASTGLLTTWPSNLVATHGSKGGSLPVDPTATRGHYRARLASCYFSDRFG
jgi:hypothetical protein